MSPAGSAHGDFRRLWAAHTVSQLGAQVTVVALPLAAAVTLGATPFEMGLLTAAATSPTLLLGLPVGVWLDRVRRRPVMIAADLARALLLLLIPAAAGAGLLGLPLLYAVAFLAGVGTLCHDVAGQSLLPPLIGRERLVAGNSRLESSRAAATVLGPGLGGLLVQALGAPAALLADAASYLVSAAALGRMAPEAPLPPVPSEAPLAAIREGLRRVTGNAILRPLARTMVLWNLSWFAVNAVLVLYATRDLGLGSGTLGLVYAAGGAGMVAGATLAGRAQRRLGVGRTIVAAGLLAAAGGPLLAVAHGAGAGLTLALAQVLFGLGTTVFGVTVHSLRQALTPDAFQGRVNATFRMLTWGAQPLGALLGGGLGAALGLRATVAVGAIGLFAAVLLLFRSRVPAAGRGEVAASASILDASAGPAQAAA